MLPLRIGLSGIGLNICRSQFKCLEEKPVGDVNHIAHGTVDEASMNFI